MDPTPRTPAPLLSVLTMFNVLFALWSMVTSLAAVNMVKLVGTPEVWARLSTQEQAMLAQLAQAPTWLLYGTIVSGMVRATLFVLSAYGYHLRSARLGRGLGSVLAVLLIAEQTVLATTMRAVGLGVVVYVVYALFTLLVLNVLQKEDFR